MICGGWGQGRVLAATKRNTGVGWEGKMKLRFVKFLTSLENEIEEKEGEDCHCVLCHPPARPRPELTLHLLLPSSFLSFLPPNPTSLPSPPQLAPPPRVGRAMSSSYPSPSCPASPFLLHKITEAEERGGKDRGGAPSLPTQLAGPSCSGRPTRRTLAPSSNRVVVASPQS